MVKLKHLLCSALSVALLSTGALAVTPATPQPTDQTTAIGQPADEETATPRDMITQRHSSPILVWGSTTEISEQQVLLESSDENNPYQGIMLHITDKTLILDAVTGEKKSHSDLTVGETLYAYTSPLMTRSIPPISNAELILCNLPADFAPPSYAEIQSVTSAVKDGVTTMTVTTDRDVILHLSAETELLAAPGLDAPVSLADLKPGTRVLAWYQMVALSLPAQASPTKLMVFPYTYGGTLSADQAGVTIHGKKLALTAAELPHAVDGTLMLPLRKVAEGLGCQVIWVASNPNGVTIQQDGHARYRLTLNKDTAETADEGEILLSAPVRVIGGVTFIAADDVLSLHQLKLVVGQV